MKGFERVGLGLCLSVLVRGGAWASPTGLEVEDEFQLEIAADPQISPDGGRVVYVRAWADTQTDKRYTSLWLVGSDGTGHRALTSGNAHDSSPRWSPDGGRIAYVSDRDGTAQIYVLWLDNGQSGRVTNLPSAPSGLSWSPDGKWLSFLAVEEADGPQIAKMPRAPEGATWAEPARVVDRLVYRFDQAGYLPTGYVHLFVVPGEGGTPRRISSGNFHHRPLFGGAAPVWTPDGKYLLLSANRRPDWDLEPLDTELYEFAVADGTVRALTNRRGPDSDVTVSPDGKWIAYVGFDDRYQGYQAARLYVAPRGGGEPTYVSKELDRSAEDPQWAPDGSGVYFLYDDEGRTKLAFVSTGAKVRTVAEDLGSGMSSYTGGGSFSLARDGRIAMTYKRADVPGDVAVSSSRGGKPRIVTAVNADLFSQRRLGAVEEIEFASSVDARKIHGWIVKPPDFDPAKKYPMILEIHGGPFASYGPLFDFEKQVWAAMGYVVLYINPRGSTSYGEEFGNLIHHAYPGDDFFDLNSGVDATIAKGFVDPQNLFVTGGSGGGVLTCWMIGRSERFRAAASAYPVINWTSWVLTSDLPAFGVKYWFPGPPWENEEHYAARSLLSVVKNVKTPTMVITGEQDWRTPISESEQYYTALKLLGVESVLVRVPGEPHGIRVRPSHHISKILHISGWFDRHKTPS
jgi:acylaminoacyl-peptidase